MKAAKSVTLLLAAVSNVVQAARYINLILPGFHPYPNCIYVEETNQTLFCATSSFSVFLGIPMYASKNLTHWKLASNKTTHRTWSCMR